MVSMGEHGALNPFHERGSEARVVHHLVPSGVALHIGFAYDPESDLVAGVEHHRVGRVVGGPDRVEAAPLDVLDIGSQFGVARRFAAQMVMVVTVHPGDQKWGAVQQQFGTDDLDPGEPCGDRHYLAHAPPRIDEAHHHAVAGRILMGPDRWSVHPDRGSSERPRVPVAVGLRGDVGGHVEHRHGGLARRARNAPAAEGLEMGSHSPAAHIAVDATRDAEIAAAE